jgi:hypothetical protein
MYVAWSAFTSSPVFLLATAKASVFFIIVYTLLHKHHHELKADVYTQSHKNPSPGSNVEVELPS